MTTQMFGAPIQRKEDPRLVTGGGRYLDDLGHGALARRLRAQPVRPRPHRRHRRRPTRVDVEGVVGIYVHEDLPGAVGSRCRCSSPTRP